MNFDPITLKLAYRTAILVVFYGVAVTVTLVVFKRRFGLRYGLFALVCAFFAAVVAAAPMFFDSDHKNFYPGNFHQLIVKNGQVVDYASSRSVVFGWRPHIVYYDPGPWTMDVPFSYKSTSTEGKIAHMPCRIKYRVHDTKGVRIRKTDQFGNIVAEYYNTHPGMQNFYDTILRSGITRSQIETIIVKDVQQAINLVFFEMPKWLLDEINKYPSISPTQFGMRLVLNSQWEKLGLSLDYFEIMDYRIEDENVKEM